MYLRYSVGEQSESSAIQSAPVDYLKVTAEF